MLYNNLDPVFFHAGPFAIRYYGLVFALGILLSFLIIRYLAKKRGLPLGSRDYDELLIAGTVAVVVGARLGHVISSLGDYAAAPAQIFAVWNGGMAFHGGFAGLVIVALIFARRKKIAFYDLADIAVIPAALALALGRIANFINGEFYGTLTRLPWGVKFNGVDGFRHPVQVYESLKNLLIFAILWHLQKQKKRQLPKGFIFWAFVFLYGALRFPLEFLKDNAAVPNYAFGLTWGQVWSIPMVVLGAFMLLRLRKGLKAAV